MLLFNLIENIKYRLQKGLPGESFQYKMAPASRPKADVYIKNKIVPKKGGVLVLVYEWNKHIYVLLTLRKEYNGVHSKQVSFPGGKFEDGDENLLNTALREAKEEVGIKINQVEIISNLTDLYIPPSNFLVSPYLAFTSNRPSFQIQEDEVEQLIEIPLSELFDENNKSIKEVLLSDGNTIEVPCYLAQDNVVWGATAMIISELEELCRGFLIK